MSSAFSVIQTKEQSESLKPQRTLKTLKEEENAEDAGLSEPGFAGLEDLQDKKCLSESLNAQRTQKNAEKNCLNH